MTRPVEDEQCGTCARPRAGYGEMRAHLRGEGDLAFCHGSADSVCSIAALRAEVAALRAENERLRDLAERCAQIPTLTDAQRFGIRALLDAAKNADEYAGLTADANDPTQWIELTQERLAEMLGDGAAALDGGSDG
jgi:hypothetical protein